MPETPPVPTTAYVCECGKKWVFPKSEVAARKVVRRTCRCGRIVVMGKGLVYGVPAAQSAAR